MTIVTKELLFCAKLPTNHQMICKWIISGATMNACMRRLRGCANLGTPPPLPPPLVPVLRAPTRVTLVRILLLLLHLLLLARILVWAWWRARRTSLLCNAFGAYPRRCGFSVPAWARKAARQTKFARWDSGATAAGCLCRCPEASPRQPIWRRRRGDCGMPSMLYARRNSNKHTTRLPPLLPLALPLCCSHISANLLILRLRRRCCSLESSS
mmetsp:Transcript_25636/g.42785  ORF Transcript_25636/g.42785 Transcript_25636/m.42785 type:complete len:212 (+) Transcript_25636:306-941(+)